MYRIGFLIKKDPGACLKNAMNTEGISAINDQYINELIHALNQTRFSEGDSIEQVLKSVKSIIYAGEKNIAA